MNGEEKQRHRAEVAEARPGWHWWLVMTITAVLGPSVAVYVSINNQHRSEHALCEVIGLSEQAAMAAVVAAPNDPRAIQGVAAMERLRVAYDCPPATEVGK